MTTWTTHWNGSRPFTIILSDRREEEEEKKDEARPPFDVTIEGRDTQYPRTVWPAFKLWAGGKGRSGSVLIQLTQQVPYRYLWVCRTLEEFSTRHPIVQFVNPVLNNDVPYPWARDSRHNLYLLLEQVQVVSGKAPRGAVEPYRWYYDRYRLTPGQDRQIHVSPLPPIKAFYVGHNRGRCDLNYYPQMEASYDRLQSLALEEEGTTDLYVTFWGSSQKVPLTLDLYQSLLRQWGQQQGFQPLSDHRVIYDEDAR